MGGDDRERRGGGRGGPRGERGDGGYRRRDAGESKEGAPGEFAPTFRGGFGRDGVHRRLLKRRHQAVMRIVIALLLMVCHIRHLFGYYGTCHNKYK